MSFNPITFDGKVRPASADGAVFFGALGDCVLDGCNITNSGNVITISAGHILAGGRVIEVLGDTSYTVSPTVASGVGRLLLNLDTSESPVFTLSEEYQSAESGFITLVTEAINITGTEYQLELCRFEVASSSISSIIGTIMNYYANKYYGKSITYSFLGDTGNIAFRRNGDIISFYGNVAGSSKFTSFANGTSVFTDMPDVFKPMAPSGGIALARTVNSQATATQYPCTWQVTTAGELKIYGNNTNIRNCQYIMLQGTYLGWNNYWAENPFPRG